MKCLGAQIDLEKNEVYLKNLSRSLAIHESRNGLFTIRLRELCTSHNEHTCHDDRQTIYHSQHIDSSDQKDSNVVDSSRVFSHAESSRHDSDNQDDFRAGDGESQGSFVFAGDLGRSSFDTSASPRGEISAAGWTIDRSPTTKGSYRRDFHDPAKSKSSPSNAIDTIIGGRDRLGSGMGNGIQCHIGIDRTTSVAGDSHDSSTSTPSKDKSSGDTSPDADNTTKDISTSEPYACANNSSQHNCIGSDGSQSGIVGPEMCQLGQEVEGDSISGGVRARSGVCGLGCSSNINSDSPDDGLPHVLPDSRTDGAGVLDETSGCLVDQDFCHLLLASFVSSPWEEQLLRASLKDVKKKEPIHLLEVYASNDSRLTKAVRDLGGKSLRFTKEDGDLSTFAGRVKLLRMVFEYSPEHLWLAPECLPWCAWNRFNQNRSIFQWERVHSIQEDSRPQLRFCAIC